MPKAKEKTIALLSTTTITTNLSATGVTALYTVPIGKTCILNHAWLTAGGDVGANLAFTIGQVGALTDFVGTTNGDNLDAANDCILIAPIPQATPTTQKQYTAGEIIQINIAVGGNAGNPLLVEICISENLAQGVPPTCNFRVDVPSTPVVYTQGAIPASGTPGHAATGVTVSPKIGTVLLPSSANEVAVTLKVPA